MLILGDSAVLEAARSALIGHGTVVSRHGRWLGEPVGGQDFDFFLRCDGSLDPSVVASLLATPGRKTAEIDPAVQTGLLEQRLANMRVELAALRTVLTRMESAAAVSAPTRQVPNYRCKPQSHMLNHRRRLHAQMPSRPGWRKGHRRSPVGP